MQAGLIDFAYTKLAWDLTKPDTREAAEVAILAARVLLDFEPAREESRKLEAKLVESRMRVVYSIPSHRQYMRSGYPSEPILAEAAIKGWEELRKQASRKASRAEREYISDNIIPQTLAAHIASGLISKGERGEVVARLLVLLAMDKAVLRQKRESKEPSPVFGVAVPLEYFLEELFGRGHWVRIAESFPDNGQGQKLKDAFKGAMIRFTHFGRAGDDTGATTYAAWAAVIRGMAIQCRPGQASIDIVLPIVLKNVGLSEQVISGILISIKDRSRASNKNKVAIDEEQIGFFPANDPESRPYIALVMDLGVQPPTGALAKTPTKEATRSKAAGEKTSTKRPHKSPNPKETSKKAKSRETTPVSWSTGATPSTPSKLDIQDSQLRRGKSATQHIAHPRYSIYTYGCSPAVYGVVKDKHLYAQLLGSRDFLSEHSRQDRHSLFAVRKLKAFWSAGAACYGWLDCKFLNKPLFGFSEDDGYLELGMQVDELNDALHSVPTLTEGDDVHMDAEDDDITHGMEDATDSEESLLETRDTADVDMAMDDDSVMDWSSDFNSLSDEE